MNDIVWAQPNSDEPAWTAGGTYQVVRVIRIFVERWDRDALIDQEQIIGREKAGGAPLTYANERDIPDYAADPKGARVPLTAHIRLANPRTPGTEANRILRRGYNYSRGVTNAGQLDMGLLFVCFQSDLAAGFLTVQSRLNGEQLEEYIKPVGGGYFFVLPGVQSKDDFFAEGLLRAAAKARVWVGAIQTPPPPIPSDGPPPPSAARQGRTGRRLVLSLRERGRGPPAGWWRSVQAARTHRDWRMPRCFRVSRRKTALDISAPAAIRAVSTCGKSVPRVTSSHRSISSMTASTFSRARRNASVPKRRWIGGCIGPHQIEDRLRGAIGIADLLAGHRAKSGHHAADAGGIGSILSLAFADRMAGEEIGPERARRHRGHLDAERANFLRESSLTGPRARIWRPRKGRIRAQARVRLST